MAEKLEERYKKEIVPELMQELGIANPMEAPKISKVSVNAGVGEFRESHEAVAAFKEELTDLLGQVPQERPAKKAISGFKIKQGDIVGISATLRGDKMWAFIDKLINIVLPRVRDFRGLSTQAFDSAGNYSLGLDDHTIFPEVNANKVKANRSLQINIITDARNEEEGRVLLQKLGFPFKKEQKS